MGILSRIFGKPVKIEHDFFGTMLFFEFKKEPHKNYFECRRHFNPAGKTIEIGVDGDKSGDMERQAAFFRRIEDNYPAVCGAVVPAVESEFGKWEDGFTITDFQKQFEAVYLALPRCETTPVEWEIAFETAHDKAHTVTAIMSGFEVKEIRIEG